MALKIRKSGTITFDGSGNATAVIGLGAAAGRLLGFEFKVVTGSDVNPTIRLRDRDGREAFAASALNMSTDDSTVRDTEQVSSTKGVMRRIGPIANTNLSKSAEAGTAVGPLGSGTVVRSPITVTLAAGTAGETCVVNLYVEV